MKRHLVLGSVLAVLAVSLYAQESLVGSYNGSFNWQTQSRGVMPLPISLRITSAADGKLQATASRGHNNKAGQGCAGEYKLSGTYAGNKLDLVSEPGGPAGDCTMHLKLVAEGNKLTGTLGKSEVELRR
jgi:hypothetical protein